MSSAQYHFPEGFDPDACRNDLDAAAASIKLRTVRETFANREAYIVPAYYLFIVLRGQKIFYQAGSELSVEPGQLLLIRKGACLTCDVARLDEGAFEAVMFLMDEAFIQDVLKKYAIALPALDQETLTESQICRVQVSPLLRGCIESLLPYFMQRSPHHSALIRLKMEELLLSLLESHESDAMLALLGDVLHSERQPYLDLMPDWIETPVTIEAMAAALHQSPTAFKQSFRRHFGQPPAQYLQERRLERAYQRILISPDSITRIALAHGYETPSHFIQVFRRRYGITPGKLRKTKGPVSV